MYFDVVQTIAEVAGALIGFVGVVFVLGQRAIRTLNARERSGLFHLLVGSVGTLIISVLIMILIAAIDDQAFAWRLGAGVVTLYMFTGASIAVKEELDHTHSLPVPLNWTLPILAYGVGGFSALTASNVIEAEAALACVIGLLMGLIVAVTYFINLLTGQHDTTQRDA